MTTLVSISQDSDAHLLRRWVRDARTEGRLVLTHEGYVDGRIEPATVGNFCDAPPPSTRVGFVSNYERAWEPTAA